MEDEAIIRTLSALAQGTRLSAYRLVLAAGDTGMSAGDIARRLEVSAPSLSGHLAILTRAGLLRQTRLGRSIVFHAEPFPPGGLLRSIVRPIGVEAEIDAS